MDLETANSHIAAKTQAKDNQSTVETPAAPPQHIDLFLATDSEDACVPINFDFSNFGK